MSESVRSTPPPVLRRSSSFRLYLPSYNAMTSLFITVALAGAAAAQVAIGSSAIPASLAYSAAPSNAGNNYAAPSATGYAPPPAASSADASSSGYAPPAYSSGTTLSAPPSQYTPPPDESYYSSFVAGGYQTMDCGYGYSKASDGSCQSQSWVSCTAFFDRSVAVTDRGPTTYIVANNRLL